MLLTPLVVLAFAAYRVTRFIIEDTLVDAQRDWLLKRILRNWATDHEMKIIPEPMANSQGLISKPRLKLYEVLVCPWCMSVWVSAGTVGLAWATWDHPRPPLLWEWLFVAGASIGLYWAIERWA
jgi:hypothetical protein